MTLTDFTNKLHKQIEKIAFTDTMAVIETNYIFTPTTFKNGESTNEAGQNSGSCKLFAFAQLQQYSKEQTLACFGEYYRNDVLKNPEGTDHQNIRNFITYGWDGISFEKTALSTL
jgi:hypothetical protein